MKTVAETIYARARAKGRRELTARRLAVACASMSVAMAADGLDDDTLDSVLAGVSEADIARLRDMQRLFERATETVALCDMVRQSCPGIDCDPIEFIKTRTSVAGVRAALRERATPSSDCRQAVAHYSRTYWNRK